MRDLIFISHRIPYPPDKGEKIRAWNLLNHLARSFRVHLGCIIDDPADWQHLPTVGAICAGGAEGFGIDKRRQKLRSLLRLRPGRPLMLDYYGSPGLQRWVDRTLAATRMDVVYVYSTAMMPYVERHPQPGTILDMQDVDSEKWATYAEESRFPMRYVWRREARTLLAYERRAALRADLTLLVTEAEVRRFGELAPESRDKVTWLEQGVDTALFDPALPFDNPYDGGPNVVFTGNMDYRPNADAVTFFAAEVMPLLRSRGVRFHIVGANPGPAVQALARQEGVHVTGRVPDVRPYVAHADLSVSPLRIARGVQNKVLEAMAMARPVVVSPGAAAGVRAADGTELLVAETAPEFAAAVTSILDGEHPGMGLAARHAVEDRYSWTASLARLDGLLTRVAPPA